MTWLVSWCFRFLSSCYPEPQWHSEASLRHGQNRKLVQNLSYANVNPQSKWGGKWANFSTLGWMCPFLDRVKLYSETVRFSSSPANTVVHHTLLLQDHVTPTPVDKKHGRKFKWYSFNRKNLINSSGRLLEWAVQDINDWPGCKIEHDVKRSGYTLI